MLLGLGVWEWLSYLRGYVVNIYLNHYLTMNSSIEAAIKDMETKVSILPKQNAVGQAMNAISNAVKEIAGNSISHTVEEALEPDAVETVEPFEEEAKEATAEESETAKKATTKKTTASSRKTTASKKAS